MRPQLWRTLIHSGSQVLCAGSLLLVIVLGVRYARAHGAFVPASTGRELVPILLALLTFFVLLTILALRPERERRTRLWWTSATVSGLCLIGLIGLWYLIATAVRTEAAVGTTVRNQAEADAYLGGTLPTDGVVHRIPTGVFVQSLEFVSANNVEVSGYVWQEYDDTVPADLQRGFVLPEAVEDAYETTEAYRRRVAGGEVIGWYFHAVLRQSFDYRRYPFDRQDMWLRLWHADFERGVILVPDFSSYTDMVPGTLPGLEQDFVYAGWDPEFAAFSYSRNRYNTSFGFGPAAQRGVWPELYYSIGLKRDFLGPLLDTGIPLGVVALLLFATLLLTTNDTRWRQHLGSGAYRLIEYAAVLMFAVILEHNQIRSSIASQQIAYVEFIPLLLYVAILLVSLNAILFDSSTHLGWIEYQDNLLPKLLYWPLLLGALLTITLTTFYR
jgi:hypothetical protein